jgi:glycine cleavage system H protein
MVVLLVLFTIISFLTIDYLVVRAARSRALAGSASRSPAPVRGAAGGATSDRSRAAELPRGFFVGPAHVWLHVEPAGTVRVGVDPLLTSFLGGLDCVYTLPEGAEVRQGGPLVMLRKGDRALRVRSPVDGVVCAVNDDARRLPGRVWSTPFTQGWLYRLSTVRLADTLQRMKVGEKAQEWMQSELGRLSDLLLAHAGATETALPDGGLPASRFGEAFGDREWEELVARFFGNAPGAAGRVLGRPEPAQGSEPCTQPS